MKNRSAHAVVYPESCPDIEATLNNLEPKRYAYILHDRDTDENGELKKPHYHVYMHFENARLFSAIANAFGIAENNVELVKSKRSLLRYFTHIDNPDKYQYSYKDIVSFNLNIENHFADVAEAVRVKTMVQALQDGLNENKRMSDIVCEIAEMGLYSDLRRSGWLGHMIVQEGRNRA